MGSPVYNECPGPIIKRAVLIMHNAEFLGGKSEQSFNPECLSPISDKFLYKPESLGSMLWDSVLSEETVWKWIFPERI